MMSKKLVYGFDVGKGSLGICVREGHEIKELKSLTIDPLYGDITHLRTRRRVKRTIDAHKKRENWLKKFWVDSNLTPLNEDDERITKEYPKNGDNTIYNSSLLRLALLQGKQLEEWQIYKAFWSVIQRRGYDKSLPWASTQDQNEDEIENTKALDAYTSQLEALIKDEKYQYPCYLECCLMGLWAPEKPYDIKLKITHEAEKVRRGGYVTPRKLVEKEIRALYKNAEKQLKTLKGKEDEFIYGPGKVAYASYKQEEYKRYRGKEWDTQGVLSQKIPRFDNRILSKCQLMPLRNTCRANKKEYIEATFLLQLKNFRYRDITGNLRALTADELNKFYGAFEERVVSNKNHNVPKSDIKKFIKANCLADPTSEYEEIKINTGGRSRLCKPALVILRDIILNGKSPKEFDISKYVQNNDESKPEKGITKAEIEALLNRVGDSWETIHIGDKRDELFSLNEDKKVKQINKIIGSVNNPVVRHRLEWFYNELKKLESKHGKPNKVNIEFVRGDLSITGTKQAKDYEKFIKANEKNNKRRVEDLEKAGISAKQGLPRLKILEDQGFKCIYTGDPIGISDILKCEIDHIVPVSKCGNDAQYNRVLCLPKANQDKKDLTPYQWLSKDEDRWSDYLLRIVELTKSKKLPKKKAELLIAKDAEELIESYNGLAETGYIARLVQNIVAVHFGWPLQVKDEKRKIFVCNGRETAKIRRIYGLNKLLYGEEETNGNLTKKRDNPKHHALDAICISYYTDLRHKKNDRSSYDWEIEGFDRKYVEEKINNLIPKKVSRNVKKLRTKETIYAKYDEGNNKACLTVRKKLEDIDQKETTIKAIVDVSIKEDLLDKLSKKLSKQEWKEMLETYKHPNRKNCVVKRVLIKVSKPDTITKDSNGRERLGEFVDFGKGKTKGQFKHSDESQGQILYFDEKGIPRVRQIYSNISFSSVKKDLKEKKLKLYNEGMLFYSGCLINVLEKFSTNKNDQPKGIYKLRTIKSNCVVIIENLNGNEFTTSVKNLISSNFTIYKEE